MEIFIPPNGFPSQAISTSRSFVLDLGVTLLLSEKTRLEVRVLIELSTGFISPSKTTEALMAALVMLFVQFEVYHSCSLTSQGAVKLWRKHRFTTYSLRPNIQEPGHV